MGTFISPINNIWLNPKVFSDTEKIDSPQEQPFHWPGGKGQVFCQSLPVREFEEVMKGYNCLLPRENPYMGSIQVSVLYVPQKFQPRTPGFYRKIS
jgi:hypothetical protein